MNHSCLYTLPDSGAIPSGTGDHGQPIQNRELKSLQLSEPSKGMGLCYHFTHQCNMILWYQALIIIIFYLKLQYKMLAVQQYNNFQYSLSVFYTAVFKSFKLNLILILIQKVFCKIIVQGKCV